MGNPDKPQYPQETIADVNFWLERLAAARKKGLLIEAIGVGFDWSYIDRVHKEIIKNLIPPDAKVVDVGCGIGRASKFFTKEQYLGFDFVPDFIELANRKSPGYTYEIGNLLEDLPYADKQFDWAVLISVKGVISGDYWTKAEKNICRIAKHILVLTYEEPAFWWEAWNADKSPYVNHGYSSTESV